MNSIVYYFVVAIAVITGCGQSQDTEISNQSETLVPDQFQLDSVVWKRVDELTPADTNCLKNFFQRNADFSGSPDMQGFPELFIGGKSRRRFYWLHNTIDGSRWVCVKFQRGKFTVSDGVGSPFNQNESSNDQ